jgi:hypothetical protein
MGATSSAVRSSRGSIGSTHAKSEVVELDIATGPSEFDRIKLDLIPSRA